MSPSTKVNKLTWFSFWVMSPRQAEGRVFNNWIEKEARAAIRLRHCVLAAKFSEEQHGEGPNRYQLFVQ